MSVSRSAEIEAMREGYRQAFGHVLNDRVLEPMLDGLLALRVDGHPAVIAWDAPQHETLTALGGEYVGSFVGDPPRMVRWRFRLREDT